MLHVPRQPDELQLAEDRWQGWLETSYVNSKRVYHIGTHLFENSKSSMLKELAWDAYTQDYVVLVQRRHVTPEGNTLYEYIAIRKAKPYKRTN